MKEEIKQIMIRLSKTEFSDVEKLVNAGHARTKADFVKTATIIHTQTELKKMKDVKK
jgi:hypothetical protein